MTAKTAITQMIGRVLRQPHARLTQKASLDECYVYTFDQDVMEAVAGVKQGLEEEGMGDVANQVKATEANKPAAVVSKETLLRRERFRNLPKIFLPWVWNNIGELPYHKGDIQACIRVKLDVLVNRIG